MGQFSVKMPGQISVAINTCGVICEIALDNGEMARLPDLLIFARRHGLRIVSIEALALYLTSQGRGKLELETAA